MREVYFKLSALLLFGFLTIIPFCTALNAQTTVQIGTGNDVPANTLYSPLYRFSATSTTTGSRSNILFTQAELASVGILPGVTITAVEFNKVNDANFVTPATYSMYMGNTSNTSLSTSDTWASILSTHTQVFTDPAFNIPFAAGWVTWNVTPFVYTGGSLEIATECSMAGNGGATNMFQWEYTASVDPTMIVGSASATATTLSGNVAAYKHRPNIKITYTGGAPCTTPPTPGVATASPSAPVCPGSMVTLNLTGQSTGDGQSYVWQSASSAGGPYTDITTSSVSTNLNINPTVTAWYRMAVTCSGNTAYSTPVEVVVRTPLPAGTYTINSGIPTGGTNYMSFADAISAISCGIAGPVVFDVALGSGPYSEQVTIPEIPGASSVNTVTFNGNGSTISYNTSVSASRTGIILNGADHIILDNLNIDVSQGTYGWGIGLTNQADSNIIRNCTIVSSTTSTSTNYAGIVINGSLTTSTGTSGNNANGNQILNNTITGGYYGVYLYGNSGSSSQNTDNIVNGNMIQDVYLYGIYAIYQSLGLVVSKNEISKPTRNNGTSTTTTYGIYITTNTAGALIEKNRLHNMFDAMPANGAAFYCIYIGADATSGSPNRVENNLIYNIGGNGTVYGIYNTGGDYMQVYHNTVSLDDAVATSGAAYGIYQTTTATGLDYKNNIVVVSRSGTGTKRCIYFVTTGSDIASNNNVLYMNAAAGTNNNLGQYGTTNYSTLADWQTANSNAYDQQSLSLDPLFINPGGSDYTPSAVPVNDMGANVGVLTDILDNTRNTASPDPGAYEFSLAGCTNPPVPGAATVSVAIVCPGEAFTLDLTGNSVGDGQTYRWQSSTDNSTWGYIDIAQTVTSYIASQTVTTYYRAAVTCNSGTTVYSASVLVTTPALISGTFTINSTMPTGGTNFQTFNDALTYIKCGINGPVVFNVAPGTVYDEQVIIPAITGTSASNTITFNGNGASLSYLSTSSSERAVIKLNGADYITIDSLYIIAPGSQTSEYGYGIQLVDNADNNTISRCTINVTTTPATASSTAFAGIVINAGTATTPTGTGDSQCDNNMISGNLIVGGNLGISIVANSSTNTVSGNKIINNTIQDFYTYGVYINGSDGTLIEGNDISRPTRSSVTTFYGINLQSVNTNTLISRNKIHNPYDANPANTNAAYGIRMNTADATTGNENIISNNMIYSFVGGAGTGVQNGILNNSSDNARIYYNSILLDDASASCNCPARGIYVQGTDVTGIDFRNNIIVVGRGGTGAKQAIYLEPTSVTNYTVDNNNYYITATGTPVEIAHVGSTGYLTLADWQGASGVDINSWNTDPLFVSSVDLHLQAGSPLDDKGTSVAGVTTDFDGQARDAGTPDIGADELPLSSGLDMKASGLVSPVETEGCYGVETITVKIKNNSTATIDFAANPVTVTVNVSGAATAVFSAVLNSGTLAAAATMDVSMTIPAATLDMSAQGVYLFDASTSVTGDVNTANDAMIQATRTKVALTAGTILATPVIFCTTGGTPTLTVTGADGYSGLQWQQSTSTGTGFTDIPGATTSTYTIGSAITQTMYYRLVASCGVSNQTSAEAVVELSDPQVLTTVPGVHCGPGEVILGATGSSGATLRWYNSPDGATVVGTGTSFTTPVLTASTTYYVSASTSSTGPMTGTIGAGATTSATYSNPFYSLWSNTHNQHLIPASELIAAGMSYGNITSLALNVTSAGTLPMIDLSVKLGTTTATDMSSYVSAGFTTVYTSASLLPVSGINTLTFSTPFFWDGTSNLVIEICHGNPSSTATMSRTVEADNTSYISTIHTHRTTNTGGSIQCSDVTTNLTTYSLRPKFIFTSDPGCVTVRVPVLATISTPPAISASATSPTICAGESTQLNVTSGNAGYTYTWNPGNLSGASQLITPSASTVYAVTATDNSGGANDGCINVAEVSVTVNPLPSPVTINPTSVTICESAPAELLTASGGAITGSIVLSEDFNGTATGWTTVNNSTGGTPANADWILRADGYTHGSTPVTFHSNDNSQFIASNSDAQGSSSTTNADLLSPVFSLFGFSDATLTFYHFYRDLSTGQPNDSATLFISTNGGSSWNQLIMYNAVTGTSNGFVPATVDLTPYVGQSNIQLRFNFYATWDWYWAIDNLMVTGNQPADITWSPLAGLFTDAAATVPYTGTATTTIYAKPVSTTTYTATATNTMGCETSGTIDVTITTSPSATVSYAGSPYCSNGGTATVSLTGSAGGTYSSTTGLTIDASTGAIDLGASTPGTYTVTYDIAAGGGCSAFSTTTSVTITTAPSATISYPGSPYCSGGGTATVTQAGTTGGTYSSTAGLSINPATGEIDLGTSTPGTYTVTYSIAAGSGCALYTTTATVSVSTSPSATISYAGSPYCSNAGTATVTQMGSAGGTYSSTTGLTIDGSTGAIDLGASTPGTYTVTYSIAAGSGCSAFSTTTTVTITTAPSATISYAGSPYCSNGGTATVTQSGSTGGTYSSTVGLSISPATGEIDPGASTAGTYTVTYTVAAANGCAVYTTTTDITITAAPSSTISYAGSPYCSNGGTATVTQTGTTGGVYSSTTGLSINPANGEIDPGTSTAGTYTVTYTVAAANGCAVYTTTTNVTVTAAPSATISYAGSPYCNNGGTATVTQTGTAGGTYSSTTGLSIDPATGAITLGTSTPGTYTVTYTVAAANGCTVYTTTTNVTVTAAPSATISYAGSPYCMAAGTATVTQTGTTGGTYSSTAGLSIDPATGTITLGTSSAGTYTVTYTIAAANGCAVFSTTTSVIVTASGTWTGAISTDWNTAGNWCGGIPTATTDVIIPGTAPNMPDLSTGAGSARNITINTGGALTIGVGGSLDLYGSITGGGAFTATNGSISFRGTSNQAAPGFTATNVTMNGNGFTPGGNITITGTLTLTNGNITLGSNNLTLNDNSSGSTTSHIVTNGTGTVIAASLAATQTRTIPVGSEAGNYNPLVLSANAGHTTDNITVRVQTGVFENGVSGAVFLTHVANQMWVINEATPGGSNVNITLQWAGSQELTSFDRAKCYVMQHNGTQWVEGTPSAASGGDPYTQTRLNVTSFSPFAVQTQPIPQPVTGIYPNPTSDYMFVVTDLQSAGPVVFSVYDSKGQLAYQKQATLGAGLSQTRLELAHLSSGVYVVKVSTRLNREFLVQRFVKTN